MGKASRDKGKAGEREVVKLLEKNGWIARRGRQYKGTDDSPDVESNLPAYIEVKRRNVVNLRAALDKAREESLGQPAIVFSRGDREPWIITMYADDFLALLGDFEQETIQRIYENIGILES